MTSSSSSIQRQLRYQHTLERATSSSSSIQRQLRYQHTLAHDKGTQMAEALGDVIFIFNPATAPLPTHLGSRHRDTDGRSLGWRHLQSSDNSVNNTPWLTTRGHRWQKPWTTSSSSSIQRQLRYQHALEPDIGTQMAEALDDVIFIFNPATTPLPTHLGARHRDTDGTCDLALVSPRTAPLLSIETTHKGVNQRSKDVTQVQQQRPESATVTLTRYACKYKVDKLHQRYIPFCFFFFKKKSIYIKMDIFFIFYFFYFFIVHKRWHHKETSMEVVLRQKRPAKK